MVVVAVSIPLASIQYFVKLAFVLVPASRVATAFGVIAESRVNWGLAYCAGVPVTMSHSQCTFIIIAETSRNLAFIPGTLVAILIKSIKPNIKRENMSPS